MNLNPFSTISKANRLYMRRLEDALTELHWFVENELDPEPGPWEAYYGDVRSQALGRSLEHRAKGVVSLREPA